ncbi:MAG: DUF1616 domain-containing protein [Eubacteriales bacterium]
MPAQTKKGGHFNAFSRRRDGIERVALSFGLSIAVVPLVGLILNYTPWGIRLAPILASLLVFVGAMKLRSRLKVTAGFTFPTIEGTLKADDEGTTLKVLLKVTL